MRPELQACYWPALAAQELPVTVTEIIITRCHHGVMSTVNASDACQMADAQNADKYLLLVRLLVRP
jgi:hypothetical protein